MALTVEDGTAVVGADAYLSVADAETYLNNHAASGSSNAFTTASTTALKEIALRNAARTIDAMFASRFPGYRVQRTQGLQWPRMQAEYIDGWEIPATEVPRELKDFSCELALRFIANTTGHDTSRLTPDQDNPGAIKSEKLKGDVAEVVTVYENGADQQTLYTLGEAMMNRILVPGSAVYLA